MAGSPRPDPTESIHRPTDPLALADRQRQMIRRPERIGHYRILDELGEGGMGVVYLAEQERPLHRRVALKVIKLGMDTKHIIARFETEREALALMSHPNVARVFDAGTTDDGRPYFAMEHVPGVRITEYCDLHCLSTDERLHLFFDVCNAIQHAHQKGIIHRDLKSGNVLVTVVEDKPVVKVIDFGVAKATQQRLTEHTLFTQQGQLIGTPGYMSPEQAEMTGLDIDTRTDIYSLGVLLYELLVGARPIDEKLLQLASVSEIQRIIREVDPPKPSTKFSNLGSHSTVIAQKHHTEPRLLTRELRGDLDWIVMKCLEKDRARRYATANELGHEIQRYLNHEPVLAGPPGPMYRLRKFGRRNRVAVLVATFMVLVVGAGAAVVSVQEDRARQAGLLVARASAYRIVLEAQGSADLYDAQQPQEARAALIAKVIADCTRAIELVPDLAPAYALRAKMLSSESSDYAPNDAERDCERALKLEPTNSLALRTLGGLRLERGDFAAALDAYEKGIRVLFSMNLPEDFHSRARLRQMSGNYSLALADRDRAVALAPEIGHVFAGRGITHRLLGHIDLAIEDLSTASKLNSTWTLQCKLWIWEMRRLRGEPGDREAAATALAQAKSTTNEDPFDQLYVDICSGATAAEQALPKCTTDRQRFFAYYYLGAKALVDGRAAEAEDWFKKCVAVGIHQSQEFDLARWHLEQLAAH